MQHDTTKLGNIEKSHSVGPYFLWIQHKNDISTISVFRIMSASNQPHFGFDNILAVSVSVSQYTLQRVTFTQECATNNATTVPPIYRTFLTNSFVISSPFLKSTSTETVLLFRNTRGVLVISTTTETIITAKRLCDSQAHPIR